MKKPRHCYYCKRTLTAPTDKARTAATRDHIVPKCAGGKKTVPCCRQCNHLKGSWSIEEWRQVMRDFPDWTRRFHSRGDLIEARRQKVWAEHRARKEFAERGMWPKAVRVPPPSLKGLQYRCAA